jgi:hypothetical protein
MIAYRPVAVAAPRRNRDGRPVRVAGSEPLVVPAASAAWPCLAGLCRVCLPFYPEE